jgi:hypothetical protein
MSVSFHENEGAAVLQNAEALSTFTDCLFAGGPSLRAQSLACASGPLGGLAILHLKPRSPGRGFLLGSGAMWSELLDLCLLVVTLGAFAIWRKSHPANASQHRVCGQDR